MKAVLKQQGEMRVSDMKEKSFAVVIEEGDCEGHIVYRPPHSHIFAQDLTGGEYWKLKPEIANPRVRPLKAGDVIEIQGG